MPRSVEVVALRRSDADRAAAVLCESHHEYPTFRHLFPEPRQRRRALRAFFAAAGRDAAAFDASRAVLGGEGRLLAVALWLPPGAFPWSARRKLRATPAFARVALAAPRSFGAFARTGTNAERAHPREAHWYLVVLGVRPEAQRQGLGSRLLAPALERADRDGLPCYLETARGENVAYYERFDFELIADRLALVPGGPTHWAMLRQARLPARTASRDRRQPPPSPGKA